MDEHTNTKEYYLFERNSWELDEDLFEIPSVDIIALLDKGKELKQKDRDLVIDIKDEELSTENSSDRLIKEEVNSEFYLELLYEEDSSLCEEYVEQCPTMKLLAGHSSKTADKTLSSQLTKASNEASKIHLSKTVEKTHTCDICSKVFMRRNALKEHFKTHGDKPYKCEECGKTFGVGRKGHLIRHMRVHCGEKPYKCKDCGKSFSDNSSLSKHKKVHSGEKPYKCDICNEDFISRGNLLKHLINHNKEKPYNCKECSKGFTRKYNLQEHMRTHNDEKPKCEVCGKGFFSKNYLIKHKKVHSVVTPYKCGVCSSYFSDNSTLNSHKKLHGVHVCNFCEETFSQSECLSEHCRVVHNMCEVCGRSFFNPQGLVTHSKIHTSDKTT